MRDTHTRSLNEPCCLLLAQPIQMAGGLLLSSSLVGMVHVRLCVLILIAHIFVCFVFLPPKIFVCRLFTIAIASVSNAIFFTFHPFCHSFSRTNVPRLCAHPPTSLVCQMSRKAELHCEQMEIYNQNIFMMALASLVLVIHKASRISLPK